MVIRAGGYRWRVEARDSVGPMDSNAFVDLTFRRVDADEERVEIGWTPRHEELDADLARNLFELAGRRRWSDPRTGVRYEVELVATGRDEDLDGPLRILFRTGRKEPGASTVYPLPRPLGLARAPELQAMLDVALERKAAAVRPVRRRWVSPSDDPGSRGTGA